MEEYKMSLTRLNSKSQIVIPAEIRGKLGLQPGDILELDVHNDSITLRKAPGSFLEALDNCCTPDLWRNYERELKESRDKWDD
jgi:AbrB family looped-hinge helix DNA binding protein